MMIFCLGRKTFIMKLINYKAFPTLLEDFIELILFLIFFSVLTQSIHFIVHGSLSVFSIVVPFLIYPIFMWYKNKKTLKWSRLIFLYFTLFIFALLSFTYYKMFIQYAWDGSDYHGGAMIQMIHGWNPFYDTNGYADFTISIWSKLYPKFTWIFGSLMIKLFGNTSAAMVINVAIAFAASAKVYLYASKHLNKQWISLVAAILVLINPVFLEQIHTFYVDGLIGNLLILLFVLNLEYTEEYSLNSLFYIILVSIILMNIKFTGTVYAAMIDFGTLLYLIIRKSKFTLHYFVSGLIILFVGIVFIGYNPYLVNLLSGRHIFYPVMGADYVEIEIAKNTPTELLMMNSWKKMIYSFKSGHSWSENLFSFKTYGYLLFDQRIGGFGSQFIKLILLSIISISSAIYFIRKKLNLNIIILSIFFILSILVNYQYLWWARYIPHAWGIIPFSVIFVGVTFKGNLPAKTYIVIVLLLSLFQGQDIYRNTYTKDITYTHEARLVFDQLKNRSHLTVYFDTFGYLNIIPVYLEQIARENGLDIETVLYYDPPKQPFDCYKIFYSNICVLPEK